MKSIIAVLCIMLCANIMFAQKQIAGKVTDIAGKQLADVTVQIKNSSIKVMTDSTGTFSIELSETENTLLFFKEGYVGQEVSVDTTYIAVNLIKTDEDYIGLSLENLSKIKVISTSKSIIPITEAPASILVITEDQIRSRGYNELDDALRDMPGFDFIRVYGVFPTIRTMRGSYGDENKRILLMIDGVVENQLIGSWELGGAVYSLHNIERIEIIWGPSSALYGANAFSGIINMITKNPEKKDVFEYHKGFGTFNTRFDKYSLAVSKKKFSFTSSGTLYNTDGPKFTNRNPDFSDAYISNAYSLLGKFIYNGKKNKSVFGYTLFNLPGGDGTFGMSVTKMLGLPDPGNLNEGNFGWIPFNINNQRPSNWHTYSNTIYFQHELILNKKLTLSAKVYTRSTGLSDDTYSYRQPSPSSTTIRKNILAHSSCRYAGELQSDYRFNENHSLIGGFQYSYDDLENGFRKTSTDTTTQIIDGLKITQLKARFLPRTSVIQKNSGAYLQYMVATKLLKYTSFTLGIRFDNNSVYGNTINPRVGIVIKPFEKFTIKTLFGTAYRAPTNFEIYSAYPGVRVDSYDLKPEKISTYELHLGYRFNFMHIQVNSFYNQLSDLIVSNVPIGNNLYQNQNKGKATVYGGEIIADFEIGKKISGFCNFTYQEAEQSDLGVMYKIPNIARYKGNVGLHIHCFDLFSINLSENWIGKRSVPATNPLGSIPAYAISNISVTTNRFLNNHVSLNMKINNVFNSTYYDPGIRTADGTGMYSTVHEQEGRVFLIKLTVAL